MLQHVRAVARSGAQIGEGKLMKYGYVVGRMNGSNPLLHALGLRAGRRPVAKSVGAAVAAALMLAAAAKTRAADDVQASTAAGTGDAQVEEIVVTARRRSESIDKVPAAVTAFGADQIAERKIETDADLQISVPGLVIGAVEDQNQISYSLRGQVADAFTSSKPAVLTYINEVQTNTASAGSFFDLSSLQVLKGPQGTLFGRNTTGGAVLFETTKPTSQFGGYATVDLGNFSYREYQGAVNLPIVSDKVLLRLAGLSDTRDGFQRNIYNDTQQGADDRKSGRATLLLAPTDNLTNTTVFEYDFIGGNQTGAVPNTAYPCGTPGLNSTVSCFYSPAADSIFGPGAWNAYLAAHPKANPGGVQAALARQLASGPYVTDGQAVTFNRAFQKSVSNTTVYNVTPDFLIKNIAAFSISDTRWASDETGLPYNIQSFLDPVTGRFGDKLAIKQGSEELQVQGKAFDHKLDYIAGVYLSYEGDRMDSPQGVFEFLPFSPLANSSFYAGNIDKSEAAFFQNTYDLSSATGLEGLSVTGGFRYTWEQVSSNQFPFSAFYPAPQEDVKYSAPSWTVGLQEQLNNHLLLYLVQRGSFRSPGFNLTGSAVNATAANAGNLFNAETSRDVEVGAKYNGEVAGMSTRSNIAIYNQWTYDVQRLNIATLPTGQTAGLTVNVPAEVVTGVELDSSVIPTNWLEVGVTFAYTDARYTSPDVNLFGVVTKYGPPAAVARFSGSVYTAVTLPTPAAWGQMKLRADAYSQSLQYYSNLNNTLDPGTVIPAYTLVNLRLDWHDVLGATGLTLSGFAKNVGNRVYYVGGLPQGNDLGVNAILPGTPRMYGFEGTYRF
jgi:iron complex outermembrane receptor protein